MIGRVVMTSNIFPKLAEKLPKAVRKLVWRTANNVRSNSMRRMAGPKSGRLYPKAAITRTYKASSKKRLQQWKEAGARMKQQGSKVRVTVGYKTHRASAPGEAPAIDYGILRGSIFTEMTGETSAIVGVGAVHGMHLEYGTRKMAKRPYLRPSVDQEWPGFVGDLTQLEKELR